VDCGAASNDDAMNEVDPKKVTFRIQKEWVPYLSPEKVAHFNALHTEALKSYMKHLPSGKTDLFTVYYFLSQRLARMTGRWSVELNKEQTFDDGPNRP
jgi:hypothetical protein